MHKNSFNNVLFLGTGGGNDIFSTTLAALSLWKQGWRWTECTFAGVLSPFHCHSNHVGAIRGTEVIHPASERFVPRNDGKMKIGYVDAAFAKMIKASPVCNATSVLGLSVTEGTVGLTRTFRELSEIYDLIVLVDIGGDIFYSGKSDAHVLSPMFDAMVLRAFIDSRVPGILFEAGPGTDGELDPESLERALKDAKAKEYPLDSGIMNEWKNLYLQWIEPVRQGRTVPITIEAFESKKAVITMKYRARAHINATKAYQEFDQRIKTSLCKKFYLVDPEKITNPFAVRCSSPFDWFVQTQAEQHATNCEANLEYFRYDGILHQFLTPSPLFADATRKEFLAQGLRELRDGICDKVFLFSKDWKEFSPLWESQFRIAHERKLVVLQRVMKK